jgi:prepilin-type N-terminal cleavage/methylation domain-containing protein
MKKNSYNQNKAYSLVEMIIVIAIIGVISVMAMVTVSIIRSARAKDAAIRFDNEIGTLISKAKYIKANPSDPTKDMFYAVKLESTGSKYYMIYGYALKDGSDFEADPNERKISLSPYCEVRYSPEESSGYGTEVDANGVVIVYNKSGLCLHGAGKYAFYKSKTDDVMANDFVRKNGSHQSK